MPRDLIPEERDISDFWSEDCAADVCKITDMKEAMDQVVKLAGLDAAAQHRQLGIMAVLMDNDDGREEMAVIWNDSYDIQRERWICQWLSMEQVFDGTATPIS